MSRRYPKPRRWFPKHPEKYIGNVDNIVARSSWEIKTFNWMDNNPAVITWNSEEIIIPYLSPVDDYRKSHRYFPDIFAKMKGSDGKIRTYLIEIKPYKETIPPEVKSRITKQYISEVCKFGVNQAKWKAARHYCRERGWYFMTLTEKDVNF